MRTIAQIDSDKRAAWARMQELMSTARTEGRAMNEAEDREYETLGQTIDNLDNELRQIQRHEARERALGEPRRDPRLLPGGEGDANARQTAAQAEYRRVLEKYLRYGREELESAERQILRTGFVPNTPGSPEDGETRAQATVPGSSGGYTVPSTFSNTVIETLATFSGAREVAEVIPTSDGREIPMATQDDTGNRGRRVAENSPAATTNLEFGQRILRAYLYSSDIVLVPITLLEDTAFELEPYIGRKLGERIGRIENYEGTIGAGNAMPYGFAVGGAIGKTFASASAITWPELVDLEHSVDAVYRKNAKYTLHDLTLAAIRKLVDDNGRPLWLPSTAGFEGGMPATINNYPYVVNNDMPQIAASANVIGFGDLREGFKWREVGSVTILRLNERYADAFQVAFLGFHRMDAAVVNTASFKLAAMHA